MKLKALIIDDEPFVRNDLRNMLEAHREITITGEAGTIAVAKKLLAEKQYDIVFLDIQLRGGTGFDLVPLIPPTVKIIFVTSHDEYALRAFDVNALDYILKPVTKHRLAQSIERVLKGIYGPIDESIPQLPFQSTDRVFIYTETVQMFVDIEEIVIISSIGGNYAAVHLKNGEKLICRKTLKFWESMLPDALFMRIHRSTIINLSYVERINYDKTGSCFVYLSGQEEPAIVSRRTAPLLKKWSLGNKPSIKITAKIL